MYISKAILIATTAHMGQVDKSGQSYILHPLRVMLAGTTEEEKIVGVLHDVIEDTCYTIEFLTTMGFSDEVIQALIAISKVEDATYKEYLKRVSENKLATSVKLHDLEDNMSVPRLLNLPKANLGLMKRYAEAWQFLTEKNHID